MSKHLEDFVKNNRDDFDKFEPGPVVWHNIQQQLKKPAAKKGILISMTVLRWSSAAAIVLMLGGGAYYFLTKKTDQPIVTAEKKKTNEPPVVILYDTIKQTPTIQQTIESPGKDNEQITKNYDSKNNDSYNEELYHYTRLVELKQNEIKKIKKDEPLLYQQFAGDFNKLDSTFHILKKQLPVNPNREQILEAMIQNLQYQEALLNQQLNIIKKINNTKKQAYENAYKTV